MRLVTVHPALVHFTIGALPVILLGYIVGHRRRSERWTFVGDVALLVTAGLTLLASGFGLVSFLVVDWPGGLDLWRWLHLGFGVAATVVLAALAIYRLSVRGNEGRGGRVTIAGAAIVATLVLTAGWIGGEVLVFRSGVAVQAAGNGALAPPVWRLDRGQPDDLVDAMGQIRSHWAAVQTTLAEVVVDAPSAEQYQAIERDSRKLDQLADWLVEHGNEDISQMGAVFAVQTEELMRAARTRDLSDVADAVGGVTKVCASCHEQLRWREHDHGQHARRPR